MKNEQAFYYDTCLLPPTFTICGVVLRPFSLGHFLILRQLGSPMNIEREIPADLSAEDGIYYLFHALLVCSMTYEDNLVILRDDQEFIKLGNQFSDNLLKNMASDKTWNIMSKFQLFKKYMSYFMDGPLWEELGKPSKETPSGSDWCQGLCSVLKMHFNYTDAEILNMSFRQALYLWASYAEEQGAIKVMNRTSLDMIARARGLI